MHTVTIAVVALDFSRHSVASLNCLHESPGCNMNHPVSIVLALGVQTEITQCVLLSSTHKNPFYLLCLLLLLLVSSSSSSCGFFVFFCTLQRHCAENVDQVVTPIVWPRTHMRTHCYNDVAIWNPDHLRMWSEQSHLKMH